MGLDLTFGRSLKAFPRGFGNLKHLIFLHLGNCQGLKRLPESICNLKMLVVLDLGNCANLKRLPKSIGELEMLVTLNLFQCSALKRIPLEPHSLRHSLKQLKSLNLLGCDNLHHIGQTPFVGGSLFRLESLRNLKIGPTSDQRDIFPLDGMPNTRFLFTHTYPMITLVKSKIELENFTLNTFDDEIKVFASDMISFLNLKTLTLSFCPNLRSLELNDCPNLEAVTLTNCPNLVCLPALDNLPRLGSLVLRLSIKELPQSFTRRGAFPALTLFNLGQSQLAEFPELEEGAMPKLQWLDFDDCAFLHTLPASISLLTSIQTINLGTKNEKLITSCKANFTNSPIWKSFNVDGKPFIPEREVFESAVPMEEGAIAMRGNEKRPFQEVHSDDEDRLIKRAGSISRSEFLVPSNPNRLMYLGSSSGTTKIEKEHNLGEAL